MKIDRIVNPLRAFAFRAWRCFVVRFPGGRIRAFGKGADQIGAIVVINLDRQPRRWALVQRELARFRTLEGAPFRSITHRLAAVDAQDGRSSAATGDVDPIYRIGDQLHVQPDQRLVESFSVDEPVRMTRQEIAVARSHIEAWKVVAEGRASFVLILEDDVWFRPGAPSAIERGWRAALNVYPAISELKLLYFSYSDAGGTAHREHAGDGIFRPVRGLWFLSGYVLSREGAAYLLRAMPVVGPVDLWMNYRFRELNALALDAPAIAQRHDLSSDNSYSMLPYLARAGVVDSPAVASLPKVTNAHSVLAWTSDSEREPLAMALSMLGLRVRAFDKGEPALDELALREVFETFDAVVDAPLLPTAVTSVVEDRRFVFLLEPGARTPIEFDSSSPSSSRAATVALDSNGRGSWQALCALLKLAAPVDEFPIGPPRDFRLFRVDRPVDCLRSVGHPSLDRREMDESPWILPRQFDWEPSAAAEPVSPQSRKLLVESSMTESAPDFPCLAETFPGNLALFTRENVEHGELGARLSIEPFSGGPRQYKSGAIASVRSIRHARCEAEIRAASGSGLITGFFLHRGSPRQEIDIEILGSNPRRILVNVYFNPGDADATMCFGYRGSPFQIDIGFDASEDFHRYAIDWRADRIIWLVDNRVVHERVGWDPTPIPHLDMRLYANVWAPRSEELAGRIDQTLLPACAFIRNLRVEC